jgi:hypothetical protein
VNQIAKVEYEISYDDFGYSDEKTNIDYDTGDDQR